MGVKCTTVGYNIRSIDSQFMIYLNTTKLHIGTCKIL